MQVIRFEDSNYDKKLKKAFSRKYSPNEKLKGSVEDIIESVRSGGDKAVRTLTKKFDQVDIKVEQFELSRKEAMIFFSGFIRNMFAKHKFFNRFIKNHLIIWFNNLFVIK